MRAEPKEAVTFNMTPMIDCTFQLIIFFILTSQVANQSLAKNVKIPRPTESQAVLVKELKLPKVIVNVVSAAATAEQPDPITAANAAVYIINGRPFNVGDSDELVKMIENTRAEAKAAGLVKEDGDFFVEIRADRRVKWADISPVVRSAVAAGVSKMAVTALTAQL